MVIKGLIGRKIGMTQIYKEGTAIPVTVIQAGPCYVLEINHNNLMDIPLSNLDMKLLKKIE